jgi:hypothetical protein
MDERARPQGIEHKHIHEAKGSIFRRWPFGLAVLAVALAPAFFGVYGSNAILASAGTDVRFTVEGPRRVRNGEFFELILDIKAQRRVEDTVVLLGAPLLRDMTINTLLPDPSEHGFRDGSFEFRFGALDAGESLQVKVDGQVNPSHTWSANRGAIAIADGETTLATVDYAMEVLP